MVTNAAELPDDSQSNDPAAINDGRRVINVSGDTVTQKTADYPEAQRLLIRRLYALAKDQGWSWDDVEHYTKLDHTTVHRVWNGSYRNPATKEPMALDGVCEKIERFFARWEARAPETRLPFMETSVWKRVSKICQEALDMQTMVFIYGESQIGKTCCLREFERRNNHGLTTYTLMPASAGVQSMMKAIADACHISANTCFESLRARVRNYFDDSKLLIIDEVHECFVSYQKGSMLKCLAILRQLQEASQCGLVLCGTNVFRSELERGEFAQAMKQLRRRGIWELQLESVPSKADLQLIAEYYKLPPPEGEPAELIKYIAHNMGLGKYTKFLHRAAMLAARKNQKMTWDHFVKVISIADALSKVQDSKWN